MSLSLLLEMAVANHGSRAALYEDGVTLTYEDLKTRVQRAAGIVQEHDVEHLVFVGRNGIAYPQLLFTAAAAGVAFAPLNYRLSTAGLRSQIGALAKPLVICEHQYADAVGDIAPVIALEEFSADVDQREPVASVDVDDASTAVVLFTSGTTSRPKAVLLRHENLVSYILSTVDLGAASADDAALVTVPPYHIAAVGSALSNIYSGRRVVYLPDFGPRAWLDLVRDQRVTTAMVVPTMLARIVDELEGNTASVPSLGLLSYGGAKMPRPVLVRALAAFPDVGFVNAYGLTETSSTIALLGPEDHREALASADPAVQARLSSVGRAVPSIELELRATDGRPVTGGEAGELWVRGPQVSGTYAEQGSVLDDEGWFPTRDIARIDKDGFLFIEGRADDTIIRGGENIHPAEIEDVLLSHSAVKEAAVIGLPDEEWGQRIVAFVVPRAGELADESEIREFVRSHLRGSRTPDQVVWRLELPHTPTGKLLRRQLATEMV
jgi:acyl-CoA synthetase (AMP-forming)/AMP-acid ligase II